MKPGTFSRAMFVYPRNLDTQQQGSGSVVQDIPPGYVKITFENGPLIASLPTEDCDFP